MFVVASLYIFNCLLLSGACLIETSSWGLDTPNLTNGVGYIIINGIVWLSTGTNNIPRGFNTVELVLSNCSVSNYRQFDTYLNADNAVALATYISNLPTSTVLVGVTADEASVSLAPAATALLNIGVDVSGLEFRGMIAFVAQIGRPSATLMIKTGQYQNTAKLNALVTRTYVQTYHSASRAEYIILFGNHNSYLLFQQ